MGAWNSSPFGNDAALDWVANLKRADDGRRFIEDTLHKIDANWPGDAWEASEAIAAAATVSAAAVDPIGRANRNVESWIAATGFVPDRSLLESATTATERICSDSELRELWQESGDLEAWLGQTQKLLDNVRTAQESGLPTRKPKRRRTPRLFFKLLERHAEIPDKKTRTKIRKIVADMGDPNKATADTNYRQPLALIAHYGLVDEARILIGKGADLGAGSPSPFVAACAAGHAEMAELLRESGAKVFFEVGAAPVPGLLKAIDGAVRHEMAVRGIEPKPPGYRYCLALFSVARRGLPRMAEYLVGLGADLGQCDLNDENLLHKASESGNVAMLDYLIDAGLDIDKTKGKFGESPLHYAARAGQIDAVRLLLERGAKPNPIDKFEGLEDRWYETPLDVAANEAVQDVLRRFGGKTAAEVMKV